MITGTKVVVSSYSGFHTSLVLIIDNRGGNTLCNNITLCGTLHPH